MDIENLEFLKDVVKNKGFGEALNDQLEAKIANGQPTFTLPVSMEHDGKKVDYSLNFSKGKDSERFFFNNFKATLADDKGKQTSQTFYIDSGRGVTAKESFNLLEGRSARKEMVTKEKVKYKAWINLNLEKPNEKGQHMVNSFGEKYGYDLEAVLAKFTIREMDNPQSATWLVKNLERGNLEPVLMIRGEKKVNDPNDTTVKERPTFIEAEPQFKSIKVYDENHSKIFVSQARAMQPQNPTVENPSVSSGIKTTDTVPQKTVRPVNGGADNNVQPEKRKGVKR